MLLGFKVINGHYNILSRSGFTKEIEFSTARGLSFLTSVREVRKKKNNPE
jgi:hypothetical protein